MLHKQKHKNQFLLVRNKIGLAQKQVALLLGHKTTDQVSRYERGEKRPGLMTAFKLQIIYNVPINILCNGSYEKCLEDIKQQRKLNSKSQIIPNAIEVFKPVDFCTIEEKLKKPRVSNTNLNSARSHITRLVNRRAKRMNHL